MSNPFLNALAMVNDTLANFTTGLGGRNDKTMGSQYVLGLMSDTELVDAYRGDWLCRKVVDIPAKDQLRAWRAWQADQAQIEAIEAEEKRLQVRSHVLRARILSRLFGGAVIIMGDGSSDMAQPFEAAQVGLGGLKYLMSLPRTKVSPGEKDWTPGANYGLPLTYQLANGNGDQMVIHHTRVVRFIGAPLPEDDTGEAEGWGDSVLLAVRQALQEAGATTQAVASLVQEAKTDVIAVPDLLNKTSNAKDTKNLLARFALMAAAKSNNGVTIVDKNEEWNQKQISFAQMPELIDRGLQIAAGAADIPAVRLLSQSPAGMNATGESDLINYYDRLKSEQENELTPTLSPLDDAVIASALGSRPTPIYYNWNPLWQLSDKDKAEVEKKRAETVKIHKETGLLPEQALAKGLRNQLVEAGVYPGFEAALKEADDAGELAPYEEPTPTPPVVDPLTGRAVQTPPPSRSPRRNLPTERAANDAATAPLYVSRPVVNAADLIEWARSQGFKTTIPGDQLHVTLAYSTKAIDWAKIDARTDTLTITRDNARDDGYPGYRWVSRLGDDGAVVLMFEADVLRGRWQEIIDAGASWDHDHFWPHVTISYDAGGYLEAFDLTAYQGPIVLGPERFDVLDPSPDTTKPREVSTEGGTD